MVEIIIVVREPESLAPEFSLHFELPEVPRIGDYISIRRELDQREPHGEDVIVRHVWWRLVHPETHGFQSSEEPSVGSLVEIFVECDPATGPYSSESWSQRWAGNPHVEPFNVVRRVIP
jgi:hypothetical protein